MLGAVCKDVQGHRPALAMLTVAESTVQTRAAEAWWWWSVVGTWARKRIARSKMEPKVSGRRRDRWVARAVDPESTQICAPSASRGHASCFSRFGNLTGIISVIACYYACDG